MRRAFSFNLPWPAIILGGAFYAGAAAYALRLANDFTGLLRFLLFCVSAILAVLGVIMLTRRLLVPRSLVLDDSGIIFPRGFPRTRYIHVNWDEIIRMLETDYPQAGLHLGTSQGFFEIPVAYFPAVENYHAVRDVISSRTGVIFDSKGPSDLPVQFLPKPLLHWIEPDEWPCYRTQLVRCSHLGRRLAKASCFFVRWFGIFVLPWLVLRLLGVPTAPAAAYLGLCGFVAGIFTLLHWLNQVLPVHSTEISIRANGITQNFGKQVHDRKFQEISAWRIIERTFQESVLRILLLQERTRVSGIAIPDSLTADRLSEILRAKGVPESSQLAVPWESS
jgi:hypothetical protein